LDRGGERKASGCQRTRRHWITALRETGWLKPTAKVNQGKEPVKISWKGQVSRGWTCLGKRRMWENGIGQIPKCHSVYHSWPAKKKLKLSQKTEVVTDNWVALEKWVTLDEEAT